MNKDDLSKFPIEIMESLPELFSKKGRLYSLSPEEVALLDEYRKRLNKMVRETARLIAPKRLVSVMKDGEHCGRACSYLKQDGTIWSCSLFQCDLYAGLRDVVRSQSCIDSEEVKLKAKGGDAYRLEMHELEDENAKLQVEIERLKEEVTRLAGLHIAHASPAQEAPTTTTSYACTECERLREALHCISLNDGDTTSSAAEKVRDNTRIARDALRRD